MSRKTLKLILFIPGIIIMLVGFVLSMGSVFTGTTQMLNIFIYYLVTVAGMIPTTIAMLMHSSDTKETKPTGAALIKALAIFWIVCGSLGAVGVIIVMIVFG